MLEQVRAAAEFIREHGINAPKIGIILGTGLGRLTDDLQQEISLAYEDIPYFPEATVEYHHGKLMSGTLEGKEVLVMNGRFHFYEGYTLQQITFPVRVMKMLGVETLLGSNACGAVNLDFKPASLMIIEDHINLLPTIHCVASMTIGSVLAFRTCPSRTAASWRLWRSRPPAS